MSEVTVRRQIGEAEIVLKAGKLAQLADGAVVIASGSTEVLVTATASRKPREGIDFFPLTIDVEERMYAVGRIPGSFFRREGRPTEKAILSARLIDRPLRPSFRDDFKCETHVIATILSADQANPYDVLALNGASAALTASPIPFEGPLGAVRLGLIGDEWVAMPTYEHLENAVFDLVVVGSRNDQGEIDLVMVEAGATEDALRLVAEGAAPSDEDAVARGLEEAKLHIAALVDMQLELAEALGEPDPVDWPVAEAYSDELYQRVEQEARSRLQGALSIADKMERQAAEGLARDETFAALGIDEESDDYDAAKKAFKAASKKIMRERVINDGIRLDGRRPDEIRSLSAEVGVVSRAHGSGLFQRGETQVLNVATLGMLRMEQMLDTISIEETKRYMHHYNFPPFSTGETGFMRGPKRREIGHGALAEKAVLPVIPTEDEFPYAFRLVSEVLMSNGSSSMASVCGSSLSLMDAGVPIKAPVAGIAMGLIAHDGGFVTLTDILGAEDALGDMDFKVAGTADVITALQLDTKISGLPADVLAGALHQAREARLKVLEAMRMAIDGPREELNANAPRIVAVQIPKDKIGEIIGPKGKMIREIEETTEASIDIEEDGTIRIGATSGESMEKAREIIMNIAYPPEPELGKEYEGEVVNITKFGAFVNILPGRDGLLHISKIGGNRRIDRVEDELNLGDKVAVVVREIDDRGKVSLDLPGAASDGGGGGPRREERRGGRDGGERREGGRDRGGDRGGRGGRDGGRDRNRREPRSDGGGDRDRDRGRDRDRDRGGDRQPAKASGRKVVSFEDEFEGGL